MAWRGCETGRRRQHPPPDDKHIHSFKPTTPHPHIHPNHRFTQPHHPTNHHPTRPTHHSTAEEPHQDPNTLPNLVVFSGSSHPMLTEEICDYLNIPVGRSLVKRWVGWVGWYDGVVLWWGGMVGRTWGADRGEVGRCVVMWYGMVGLVCVGVGEYVGVDGECSLHVSHRMPLLHPTQLMNFNATPHNTTQKRKRSFADGEVFVRILQEIRGRDCFVIVPTNSNDKYVKEGVCL